MRIACVGCAHGEIEEIVQQLRNQRVDLLICCGDFQAVRNEHDLATMACPMKYRRLHSFYKFYSGELSAPFPIVVIGGNHEASNYLHELYHGGWLAPNIYYLGAAGSIMFGGLRIAGVSGIFKAHHFEQGQFETLPLSESHLRSVYHVRRYNVWRLSQLHGSNVDIFVSHDWPTQVWKYGDWHKLIQFKSHFIDDLKQDRLGNPALNHLLFQLQPKRWFSGHLHANFAAVVPHNDTGNVTQFQALDKFMSTNHRKRFVQIFNVPHPQNAVRDPKTGFYQFEHDARWLAIVKSTNAFMSVDYTQTALPALPTKPLLNKDVANANKQAQIRWDYRPTQQEIDEILRRFEHDLTVPRNFCRTAAIPSNPHDASLKYRGQPPAFVSNPQTQWLMNKLGLVCKITEKHVNLSANRVQKHVNENFCNNETNQEDQVFQWKRVSSNNDNDTVAAQDMTCCCDMDTDVVDDPNEIDLDL